MTVFAFAGCHAQAVGPSEHTRPAALGSAERCQPVLPWRGHEGGVRPLGLQRREPGGAQRLHGPPALGLCSAAQHGVSVDRHVYVLVVACCFRYERAAATCILNLSRFSSYWFSLFRFLSF